MLAKVFQSGNSQAVRIPMDFRFDVDTVEISERKMGMWYYAQFLKKQMIFLRYLKDLMRPLFKHLKRVMIYRLRSEKIYDLYVRHQYHYLFNEKSPQNCCRTSITIIA